jgi:hypothetical protein
MDKHPLEAGIEDVVKTYELLDRVRLRQDIVVRDDQFAPEALVDAARLAAGRGVGLGLLDTGRFDAASLEALIGERVRFYTSDGARPNPDELGRILRACLKAGTFLALFHRGPLEAAERPETLTLGALLTLAGDGADIHLSNVAGPRDFAALVEIAGAAASGGGHFVYYHHGSLAEAMKDLAGRGAWIHVSDKSLQGDGGAALGLGIARAARGRRSGLAVHITSGLPLADIEGLFAAGARLLFQTPPSDFKSLQRPLERKAARRKLPVRAFYLTTAVLP